MLYSNWTAETLVDAFRTVALHVPAYSVETAYNSMMTLQSTSAFVIHLDLADSFYIGHQPVHEAEHLQATPPSSDVEDARKRRRSPEPAQTPSPRRESLERASKSKTALYVQRYTTVHTVNCISI